MTYKKKALRNVVQVEDNVIVYIKHRFGDEIASLERARRRLVFDLRLRKYLRFELRTRVPLDRLARPKNVEPNRRKQTEPKQTSERCNRSKRDP